MQLSKVLKQMNKFDSVKLQSEKSFSTLGLIEAVLHVPYCTFLDNEKYMEKIPENVSMVITTDKLSAFFKEKGVCIAENPRQLFFEIHNYLSGDSSYVRKKFDSKMGDHCNISSMSSIAKNNVIIGNNVIVEEFVVIRENTTIGDDTVIRAGAKIGGHGYEFKRLPDSIMSVEHLGGVVIGNNVEIKYNSCVDRGIYPWDNTIIGNYSKIDNLVHIAHGVKVGSCAMITALSGVGGRTVIEDHTWIGIGSILRNGIKIGRNARANMGSVVTKNVKENQSVTGNFAIDHKVFMEHLKKMVP